MGTEMFDAWVRHINGPATATPLTGAESAVRAAVLATAIYERWYAAAGAHVRDESAWLAEVSQSLQGTARVAGPAHPFG